MVKRRNENSGGKNTNKNGLYFEKRTSLIKVIKKDSRFKVKNGNKIYKNKVLIGMVFEPGIKNAPTFNSFLKSEFGIDSKKELGKTIQPDKVFYNIGQKRFYVIECKSQKSPGSVDEKLQTFQFKRAILNYLLFKNEKSKEYDLEYLYVLNSNFF